MLDFLALASIKVLRLALLALLCVMTTVGVVFVLAKAGVLVSPDAWHVSIASAALAFIVGTVMLFPSRNSRR